MKKMFYVKRSIFTILLFIFSFPTSAQQNGHPSVLSTTDSSLYQQIFLSQKEGRWTDANKLIAQVSDPVLMGHVQHQRYMHPTKYRSSYEELATWMSNYADQPGANLIYSLALKRRGSNSYPKAPVSSSAAAKNITDSKTFDSRSKNDKTAASSFKRRLAYEISRKRLSHAEKLLWAMEARDTLTNNEWIDALTSLAESYFYAGNDEKAFALAELAIDDSPTPKATALWIAGLAAWRQSDCTKAKEYFTQLSDGATNDAWLSAAGGVWAARSAIACRHPETVSALLEKAATYKMTFYGLIAQRQLGLEPFFRWTTVDLNSNTLDELLKLTGVRRAIALVQAQQPELADEELRLVWSRHQTASLENLIALASALNLPATQVIVARSAADLSTLSDSPFYPVPSWQPESGFEIDRAFLFAIMRQESNFMPRAKSSAGALGLMQLMPATASFIMRDRSLRLAGRERLYDPVLNMTVAQTYLHHLFSKESTGENLLKVTGAYHSGPGNVAKWQSNINHRDDPLLFIETIPGKEARNYLEKVLSNYWIYQHRLGQPRPSLDALASGAWPIYDALDAYSARLAGTHSGSGDLQN